MNKYDDKYVFRKGKKDDLYDIAFFFDNVWKKNGILSNVEFLSYEFGGKDEEINIILAIEKKSNEIQGLWGYYPFSMEMDALDVAGGPWSVKQGKNNIPFLGNEILVRAKEIIGYRAVLSIGDNKNTSGFYHKRFRKDVVGRLNHFYLLNEKKEYKIAIINDMPTQRAEIPETSRICINKINRISDIDYEFWVHLDKNAIPYKNKEYVEKRFFKHPIYEYQAIGLYLDKRLEAVFFMRLININGNCVNRIVDYIGNKKCVVIIGRYLRSYMKTIGCEYTDFYNYGFDKELMLKAGFVERKENDANVIPNYFEPFLQKNIEIYFSSSASDITLCKADGDQDRPNYLRSEIIV